MTVPFDSDINYALPNKTKIGFNYVDLGTSYKPTNDNIQSNYVQNNSLEFSTYSQRNLFNNNNVILLLKTGVSTNSFEDYPIDQKIDFTVSSSKFGDHRMQQKPDIASSFHFKIESAYRSDLSENKK